MVVDEYRAALGAHPGGLEDGRVGPHADGHDDEVGRDPAAVGQDDCVASPFWLDGGGGDSCPHVDAERSQFRGDQGGQFGFQRRQHMRGQFDDGDVEALVGERLGGFQPDEPGTQDDGVAGPTLDAATQGEGVVNGCAASGRAGSRCRGSAGRRRAPRGPARGRRR